MHILVFGVGILEFTNDIPFYMNWLDPMPVIWRISIIHEYVWYPLNSSFQLLEQYSLLYNTDNVVLSIFGDAVLNLV